jgi:hypothetical protein
LENAALRQHWTGTPYLRIRGRNMKKLLLIIAPLVVTACSSAPNEPEIRASEPVVFGKSQRLPGDIASCLTSRLSGVRTSVANGITELTIGRGSKDYGWLITLTPSGSGSIVKAQKSPGDDGPIPEPEVRVGIARCTT